MTALETETLFTSFRVSGNNWHNFVHVNVEEFSNDVEVFMEAATRGVEKFEAGEYARTDITKDKVGFGRVIKVEDEDKNSKGFRSDVVVANAGLYREATEIKKLIDGK